MMHRVLQAYKSHGQTRGSDGFYEPPGELSADRRADDQRMG
jgi:hypothetical protein